MMSHRFGLAVVVRHGLAMAAITLAGVLGAGCGSPGSGGSGPSASAAAGSRRPASNSAAAAPANPCSLITRTEINQVMGKSFPPPKPQSVGTYKHCITQDAAGTQVTVALPPQPGGASKSGFELAKPKNSTVISGLGDAAYCSSLGMAGYELSVLKGPAVVETSADSCAHAKALAQIVLSHL